MICVPEWKVALIGSAFFLGWVSTLLWIPRISDLHGRKRVIIAGLIVSSCLYVGLFFVTSINFLIGIMFGLGAMRTINISVSFVYLIEMMPREKQTLVGTIFLLIDVTIFLFGTLYFWFISNNYRYFLLVGCLM